MIRQFIKVSGLVASLLSLNAVGAPTKSNVEINGKILSPAELVSLEVQIGAEIAPGRYLVDRQSGCWLNTTTVQVACISDPGRRRGTHGQSGD